MRFKRNYGKPLVLTLTVKNSNKFSKDSPNYNSNNHNANIQWGPNTYYLSSTLLRIFHACYLI